jgi:hypothetical protein
VRIANNAFRYSGSSPLVSFILRVSRSCAICATLVIRDSSDWSVDFFVQCLEAWDHNSLLVSGQESTAKNGARLSSCTTPSTRIMNFNIRLRLRSACASICNSRSRNVLWYFVSISLVTSLAFSSKRSVGVDSEHSARRNPISFVKEAATTPGLLLPGCPVPFRN